MSILEKRKNRKAIEAMFAGLDDELLKQTLLTAYAGEDPKILEEMQNEHNKNMEEVLKHMEIKNVSDLVSNGKMIQEENKSQDNVDGNN